MSYPAFSASPALNGPDGSLLQRLAIRSATLRCWSASIPVPAFIRCLAAPLTLLDDRCVRPPRNTSAKQLEEDAGLPADRRWDLAVERTRSGPLYDPQLVPEEDVVMLPLTLIIYVTAKRVCLAILMPILLPLIQPLDVDSRGPSASRMSLPCRPTWMHPCL